jgi:signal transduction histidine kinase
MKLMKRKPGLMTLLVMALLALLPLLAVLQYHWLGEVSRGERERMKNNLQASAAQFGQEFDREIKNAFLHFQSGIFSQDETTDAEISEMYRRWQSVAAHPRLVSEIYQISADENGYDRLTRFSPTLDRFEKTGWPDKLSYFRQSLEQQRKATESAKVVIHGLISQNHGMSAEKGIGSSFIRLSIGPVDDQIPALIIPLTPPPQPDGNLRFKIPFPRAYRIVALDLDYIKQRFIPELVNRHFYGTGEKDYHIAVVNRQDPEKVIYQSDSQWSADALAKSDVSDNFFKIRMGEFDRMILARSRNNPGGEGEKRAQGHRVAINLFQTETNISNREGAQKSLQSTRAIFGMNSEGFWQIAAKHRAGSLEAAVSNARWRNLTISFGILLLLGLSVGLIVLSSRRAQKLATQQMEFVAGVSHELRTPLAVICSAAENLADGVIDNNEQIRRYGGLIRDEGRRLTEMVEQVLEFAGAQSGRKSYDLRLTEVGQVIDHALAACQLQVIEGGFEIEKKIAGNLTRVNADMAALSRAIQNLLSNSMKYSTESRLIGLSAESVQTESGEEIQIKVTDHGLGIKQADLPHIFEPFYRGKEVAAAQIHGNGLGLSLVKHIIEVHGGRVSVESKPKLRTDFILHLPVVSTEDLSTESAKENYEQTHFAR